MDGCARSSPESLDFLGLSTSKAVVRPRNGPKGSWLTEPTSDGGAGGDPGTTCPPFAAAFVRALAKPAEARHEMKFGEGGSGRALAEPAEAPREMNPGEDSRGRALVLKRSALRIRPPP